MRALLLDGSVRLERAAADPVPREGEVLVEIVRAGICATDLQLARGYQGFRGVLGHEFVGRVRAPGTEWHGRRVVADINLGCGRCAECATTRGAGHHCSRREVVGIRGHAGVFADLAALPTRSLVEVPAGVDDELAVFAEPLAAAMHAIDELPAVEYAGPVAVVGDGKLGLLCAMTLLAAGYPVTLVGRHADKLAIAAGLGATVVLADELAGESGYEQVIEASGSTSGLAFALRLTRPRGTVVLKTTVAAPIQLDLARVVVDELRLVGSRCGDLRAAVAALAAGRVDPRPLIAARYSLEDAEAAFEHAARPGTLKVLLSPST